MRTSLLLVLIILSSGVLTQAPCEMAFEPAEITLNASIPNHYFQLSEKFPEGKSNPFFFLANSK